MSISLVPSVDGTKADIQIGGVTKATIDNTGKVTATSFAGNGDLVLPSQTGNSGKFLTTNGSAASWGGITGSPEFLPYVPGRYYGPLGAATSASVGATVYSGKMLMQPFWVHATQTFSAICCSVTTLISAKTIRLGIYSDNNGTPGTLILDAGTASFATAGQKDIAISQSLSTGMYWLALVTDATATGVLTGYYLNGFDANSGTSFFSVFGASSIASSTASTHYTCLSGTQAYGALPSTPPSMSAITSTTGYGPALFLKAA